MRATRFRLRAGLLSWDKKDGTQAKNERILSLIPSQYKRINCTKGWRDLNEEEIKKVKAGALRKPQQGPKSKRAAAALAVADDSGESEGDDDDEGTFHNKDTSNNTSSQQDNNKRPKNHPEHNGNTLPLQKAYCENSQHSINSTNTNHPSRNRDKDKKSIVHDEFS